MLLKRRFLMVFLALILLLRSTAGLTMQIEMTYATNAHASASTAAVRMTMPCHTDANAKTLAQTPSPDYTTTLGHSACELCCVPALLPSRVNFTSIRGVYPVPFAALFNNLPAPAQRPIKPPLV
jgi:hypothetical protein